MKEPSERFWSASEGRLRVHGPYYAAGGVNIWWSYLIRRMGDSPNPDVSWRAFVPEDVCNGRVPFSWVFTLENPNIHTRKAGLVITPLRFEETPSGNLSGLGVQL